MTPRLGAAITRWRRAEIWIGRLASGSKEPGFQHSRGHPQHPQWLIHVVSSAKSA